MPNLEDLKNKVSELEAVIDAEQQQIQDLLAQNQATITGLNGVIADLQGQVAAGGTDAERQAIIDKLETLKTDIQNTVDGVSASPGNGGNGGDSPVV